ncbi:trypsin-like peptidase domain-containing protein [Oceanimonas sp. NS1]|nr:trypsin-like peptidase domain-containing protein [Oceanimonas sp. NS1]
MFAIGAPAGLDKTLTEGIVSARRSENGVRLIQTTAPISYGSSGAACLMRAATWWALPPRG